MKLFDIVGTTETVAARTSFDAYHWYMDTFGDEVEEEVQVREVEESQLHTRKVYDCDGLVHGYDSMVTFAELMSVEEHDWDGVPYLFNDIEN